MARRTNKFPEPDFLPAIKRKRGRASLWQDSFIRQVYYLSLLGLNDVQLAQVFQVHAKTVELWKRTKPEFFDSMQRGKALADSKVAHALYQSAIGSEYEEEVILTNRVREYDDNGKIVREYTKPLRVKTTKQRPPNVTACFKWLQARKAEVWGRRIKIEGQIDHTHMLDLSRFTEEDLEMLKEMQKKQLSLVQDIDYDNVD